MKTVVIESPYAGEIDRNVMYARRAVALALKLGVAPIASHLLYTQPGVLRDWVPADRRTGIAAGLAFHSVADEVWFFVDYGWSLGMRQALANVADCGLTNAVFRIGENP